MTPGHFVSGARGAPAPLVLASPHSGRAYPPGFVSASALDIGGLRRAEDAYVDELLTPAAETGAPMITARWARAYIDLNRDPQEIDLSMLSDPAAIGPVKTTERVRSGLGVVPRLTGPGLHIYRNRISSAAVLQRIAAVHAPYHQRLAALVEEAAACHGYALLIDGHSMPPLSLPARQRPQIVIGDAGGTSAPESVVRWVEAHFRRAGLRVARNTPYAGGYTTRFHGAPVRNRFAIQIEIDRTLYMNPETLERHAGFSFVAETLKSLVSGLLVQLPQMFGRPQAIAAE
ncbi:N-formylglutamate amidohydrolase [Sphingosinicella soli]|uniref:N-formylglutamate deformylase n=1 Tax=Sphingosinicella soli TaxID=333708 RepID=A0A7W7B0W6_9SPHN|nr:N-formylglutamate deformylase [Sphingosinicella soli]